MRCAILTLGIDPGLTGALALLTSDGEIELLADLPIIRDKSLAWVSGGELQSTLLGAIRGRPCRALVERVSRHASTGRCLLIRVWRRFWRDSQRASDAATAPGIVTPAVWKRALGLSSNKRTSLDKARLLFAAADLRLAKHD